MSDNLKIWEALEDVDPKYTKAITGKPYKGTSPNPHYIVRMLTEQFGPVGVGWGCRVVSEGFQPLGDEVLHWCRVEMWHTDRGNTFEAYGQTKALSQTRNGLKSDEDAPKKSYTDAMVKAASYVGVAANIFLGRWDDSRFVEQVNEGFRAKEAEEQEQGKFDQKVDTVIARMGDKETLSDLTASMQKLEEAMPDVAKDPRVIAARQQREQQIKEKQQ